ncbi:hypothetical protein CLOP_g8523 [Closterium sp. NIES-67]|nr:hypothetical protein CLOP_g8523 [Closterium sp. NIES-67]
MHGVRCTPATAARAFAGAVDGVVMAMLLLSLGPSQSHSPSQQILPPAATLTTGTKRETAGRSTETPQWRGRGRSGVGRRGEVWLCVGSMLRHASVCVHACV